MSQVYKYSSPSAWSETDLSAVRHNFREIRKLAVEQLEPRKGRDVDILCVVKADAYGHGVDQIWKVLWKEGCRFFAVSNLEEGAELRQAGCRGRIILFEATFPEQAPLLFKYDLTPGLCTLELARALDLMARRKKIVFPVHLKLDTGMGRLGVWHKDARAFVDELMRLRNIHLEGMFTHFPVADTDSLFTEQQIRDFSDLLADLIQKEVPLRYLHAANSMGLLGYKNRFFNVSRPGVMLYGLYPSDSMRSKLSLRPVLTVKARVLLTKVIHKGRGISYGHTFTAKKDLPVAIVSIGYSDGYSRALSNKASMLINGVRCPVLGRVTMDQTIVDISKAGKVKVGDEVVVLGRQKKSGITADELAAWAGTINYEIACSLGNRLPRKTLA